MSPNTRQTSNDGAHGRLFTIAVAFASNVCVATAKTIAAIITGSASMAAEAAHSWADTGNQVFLLVAERKSRSKPTAEHPLGFGRESYVWSMFAAVGLFVSGAVLSALNGIEALINPSSASDFTVAYIVLAIALLLEGMSFLQAYRRSRADSTQAVWKRALVTSDSTLRAVLAEDGTALLGLLIAAVGIGLHHATGSVVPDAVGSILVGLLLGVVAVVLIDRNRRFLLGQPVPREAWNAVLDLLSSREEVDHVTYLRMEYVGPDQVYVVASVDIVGDRPESDVASVLRRLERCLEQEPEIIEVVMTISISSTPALIHSPNGAVGRHPRPA